MAAVQAPQGTRRFDEPFFTEAGPQRIDRGLASVRVVCSSAQARGNNR